MSIKRSRSATAGFGFGVTDPFTSVSTRALCRHPRRDDAGHGGNGGGTGGGGGNGGDGGNGNGGTGGTGNSGAGGTGAGGGSGAGGNGAGGDKAFTPITTQEDFDKALGERLGRERDKYSDYDTHKDKSAKYDDLVKSITGGDGDGDGDPVKLAETASNSARETKVENAVLRRAPKLDAVADKLVDSRDFWNSVKDFDPAATDFNDKLDAVIKKAVENDSSFKAGSAGSGSGGGDDPYLRSRGGSLNTSSRDQGAAEADRRFGKSST